MDQSQTRRLADLSVKERSTMSERLPHEAHRVLRECVEQVSPRELRVWPCCGSFASKVYITPPGEDGCPWLVIVLRERAGLGVRDRVEETSPILDPASSSGHGELRSRFGLRDPDFVVAIRAKPDLSGVLVADQAEVEAVLKPQMALNMERHARALGIVIPSLHRRRGIVDGSSKYAAAGGLKPGEILLQDAHRQTGIPVSTLQGLCNTKARKQRDGIIRARKIVGGEIAMDAGDFERELPALRARQLKHRRRRARSAR